MHDDIIVKFQVINICGVKNENHHIIPKCLPVKLQVDPGQTLKSPVKSENCPEL